MTLSATVTVDGSPLSLGDEVAVYSVHPVPGAPGKWERTLIGHHVAGSGEVTITMPVYGDDNTTTGVTEGAVPGEEIGLVLWRASEGKEYPAYRTSAGSPVAVTWFSGIVGTIDLDFTSGERIPLRNSAWNLFSYGVLHGYQALNRPVPTAAQLPGVVWDNVPTLGDAFPLQSIAGKYDRLLGNDGTGTTFWNPALPGVSSMAYLAPGYGYWVKMKTSSEPLSWLTVPGGRTVGTEPLLLNPGWTLAGYWGWPVYHVGSYSPWDGLYPVDVYDNAALPSIGDLWSSLGSDYVRITSFDGSGAHLWNPSQPTFSTMKYLAPGYGYWVKMSASRSLSYAEWIQLPTAVTHPATGLGKDNTVLHGSVLPNGGATTAWFEWGSSPTLATYDNTATQAAGSGVTPAPVSAPLSGLLPGTTYYYRVAAANGAGTRRGEVLPFNTAAIVPPDPVALAPTVDPTVATMVYDATGFLYTGSDPVQTGVAPGTIEPDRAAVLRGKVIAIDNTPLPGVKITVLSHPEFGRTFTRADGVFDLAVNGGGYLTVTYEKAGYLSAQRKVNAPWQDYAWLPDVALIPFDARVTTVDLTSPAPIQVARGSVVADADGPRQATILFPQGTTATMVMPDNTTRPLTTLSVRATEYTVGPNGPKAMPAELPTNVAYTYCVELSTDEAIAAGATGVQFGRPVIHYVENFRNFPVGDNVPLGYYDPAKGVWISADNGRVIKILSVSAGMADLDVDGDGAADNTASLAALGVTDEERLHLASLYSPGASLWRVPIPHLSTWDANWGVGPPDDAEPPKLPDPLPEYAEDSDCKPGSIVDCQNQSLGESVPVAGTPFRLHYGSDRAPGNKTGNTLNIQLSDSTTPPNVVYIDLRVEVAGQYYYELFPNLPNQVVRYTWDGKDAYGRTVEGKQFIRVRIGYAYYATYQRSPRFGYSGNGIGITGTRSSVAPVILTLWTGWEGTIGGNFQAARNIGGWSLDVHHAYDVSGKILYLGTGERRSDAVMNLGALITGVAGTGALNPNWNGEGKPANEVVLGYLQGIGVGPDGGVYFTDTESVRRVAPDGIISTVVGINGRGFLGDGGPARDAKLYLPQDVAVGPDGSLFIADTYNNRIRRVGTDGIIRTVAGNGQRGYTGDGGPATGAALDQPSIITVDRDGNLYIRSDWQRIRRVGTDGIITAFAGTGQSCSGLGGTTCGDGGPATLATFYGGVVDFALGPDGSMFIAEGLRIRKVGPDGIINTVIGVTAPQRNYQVCLWYEFPCGNGGPASQAKFQGINSFAFGSDGSIYISETWKIRKVWPDGIITALGPGGVTGFCGNGMPANSPELGTIGGMLAAGPDGSLIISRYNCSRVSRIGSTVPRNTTFDFLVASKSGDEIYNFSPSGRHMRTLHTLTGSVLYDFGYDGGGNLISVTDGDGNVTTIGRDGGGNPVAIVGPFGHRNSLATDGNGNIATVANPAGETFRLAYTGDGLLTSFTDPRGNASSFSYDGVGRLVRDDGPAGGFLALQRTERGADFTASVTSAMGRTSTYDVSHPPTGGEQRTNTAPTGARSVETIGTDGTRRTVLADNTVVTVLNSPDPRFGMQSPIPKTASIRTPGALLSNVTVARAATLASKTNPLSLIRQSDNVVVNGRLYTTVFDNATRQVATTTPQGRQSVATIDERGRPTSVRIDPTLYPLTYAYNSRGDLERFAWGDQRVDLTYDALGRVGSRSDAAGGVTVFGYDAADRFRTVTLPSGRNYGFEYDANGNVVRLTMPSGAVHTLGYTTVNLDNSYTPPDNPPYAWSYDLDRDWTRTVFPGGRTVDAGYDAGGRRTGFVYPEAAVSIYYAPGDNTSRVSRVVRTPAGGGTPQEIAYTYDGPLVTGKTFTGVTNGRFRYLYDNNFFLKERILESGTDNVRTVLARDNDGLVTSYGPFTFTRGGPAGSTSRITDGVMDIAITYDNLARVSTRSHNVSGQLSYQVQYAYDNVGRIAGKTETVAGTAHDFIYSYDADGQLVGVTKDGLTVETYGYDVNGNRTLRQDGSAPPVLAAYDNQDRLVTSGGIAYTFDADGYMGQRGSDTFRYSARGELLESTVSGQTVTYAYDGYGRLVARTDPGGTTQYLYGNPSAPFQVTASRDPANVLTYHYYIGSRMFAYERAGIRYYMATDSAGSPAAIADSSGNLIRKIVYDSFGNLVDDTSPGIFLPVGFRGGIDGRVTALVRFGYREYEPSTGRWTAKDPILFKGNVYNLYVYANNNPMKYHDPDGLELMDWIYDWYYDYFEKGKWWEDVKSKAENEAKKEILKHMPEPVKLGWNTYKTGREKIREGEKMLEECERFAGNIKDPDPRSGFKLLGDFLGGVMDYLKIPFGSEVRNGFNNDFYNMGRESLNADDRYRNARDSNPDLPR
jgi:RHS repeat-associated protein